MAELTGTTYHVYFRSSTSARLAKVSLGSYFTCGPIRTVTPVQGRSIEMDVTTKDPAFPDAAAKARSLSRIQQIVNRLDALIYDPPNEESA